MSSLNSPSVARYEDPCADNNDTDKAESERLLTTKEAAKRLGYASHRGLENLRLRGSGPAYLKLPTGAVRYTVGALDEWAAFRRRPGEVLSAMHLRIKQEKAEERKQRDRLRKARQRAERQL